MHLPHPLPKMQQLISWGVGRCLWPPQGHHVTHRKAKIMDLQPSFPSFPSSSPVPSAHSMASLDLFLILLKVFLSRVQPVTPKLVIIPSGRGFCPLKSSYFKSIHIFSSFSMEQQRFTTELALLATFCYVLSYLWLQNKMLLIFGSSGDEYVSNTSLAH